MAWGMEGVLPPTRPVSVSSLCLGAGRHCRRRSPRFAGWGGWPLVQEGQGVTVALSLVWLCPLWHRGRQGVGLRSWGLEGLGAQCEG